MRKKAEDEWNRLDAYEVLFHERVREGYLKLAHEEPSAGRLWMPPRELTLSRKIFFKSSWTHLRTMNEQPTCQAGLDERISA